MGRADQRHQGARAMFVNRTSPKKFGEIVRRHPEVAKARAGRGRGVGSDRMTLQAKESETHTAVAT